MMFIRASWFETRRFAVLLTMRSHKARPHPEEPRKARRLEGWATGLKLHARRLLELRPALAEIEEGLRMEAEHRGEQRRGKLLDAGVVFLDRVVEEAPRRRKLVLDVGELALQLLEIFVGLQIRIGLRQREQLAQRAGQHVLGGDLLLEAWRRHRGIARLDHSLERAAL